MTTTCAVCLKTFSRTTTLKRHMLIHENKANYKCNKCQNYFQRRDTYLSHLSICCDIIDNPVRNISDYESVTQIVINTNDIKNEIIDSSDYGNLPPKGIGDGNFPHSIDALYSTHVGSSQRNDLDINAMSTSSTNVDVSNYNFNDNDDIKSLKSYIKSMFPRKRFCS